MLPAGPARRILLRIAGLNALLGSLTYARVLGLGFAYDDHWTIVDNAALGRPLGELLGSIALARPGIEAIPDSSRPFMLASVWLDRRLFGSDPTGFHLASLSYYALACAAVTLLLYGLSRRVRIAAAGGAFFALAPVHAEAVAAINYREDVLAGLAVALVATHVLSPRGRRETPGPAWTMAVVLFAGLLAKESAVALFLVLAGVVALRGYDRRWFAARTHTGVALALVTLVYGGWRAALRVRGLDNVPLAPPTDALGRLAATARFEVEALAHSLFPFGWSPEYDPRGPASPVWLVVAAALVATCVLFARRRSTRLVAIGFAMALLAALPSSPLVGPSNERADRYLFLSLAGGGLAWGWLAEHAARVFARRCPARWLAQPLLGSAWLSPLLLPMALACQPALSAWKDDLTLWTVASEKAPRAFRSWVGLSRAQRLAGELPAAEASVDRALALYPGSLSAHVTRAYVRLARGDVAGARSDIARVRELGGARQRGLAHAAHCAELSPEQAGECIDGKR